MISLAHNDTELKVMYQLLTIVYQFIVFLKTIYLLSQDKIKLVTIWKILLIWLIEV